MSLPTLRSPSPGPSPLHDAEPGGHRADGAIDDWRRRPLSIYEVDAASWDRDEHGEPLTWDRLADRLIAYVADLAFTHIGFLPIDERPAAGSPGPAGRPSDREGFARFVDRAHRAGVAVLVDWAPVGGTTGDDDAAIDDTGQAEVARSLIDDALRWTGHCHVDGLRIAAVTRMLYHDYGRTTGERTAGDRCPSWDAVASLRALNRAMKVAHPHVFTIAEEATAWPGVTLSVDQGGLGFGFKANRGWVHDTLRYFAREAGQRRDHHAEISVGIGYAYAESFVLPLGHHEAGYASGSLLSRMAGDDWTQFANLRALYGLMWGHPGKKLLFMGQEFAQRRAWSGTRPLDWHLRSSAAHDGVRTLVRDLNRLYRDRPALHARDCEIDGFAWLVVDDAAHSVFAWLRRAPGAPPIVVVANLTPVARAPYRVPLPDAGEWREVFNSDAAAYWGTNLGNPGAVVAVDGAAWVTLPPLATIMLEHRP